MADFPIIGVLLGLLVLLPLYFTIRLFQQLTFIVLAIAMIILAGVGFFLTASTGSQPIFALFLILSMISLPITLLHYILSNAKEWLMSIARGRL